MVALALARSPGAAAASSLNALIFLVGFVLAGLAPLLIGLLRDLSGGFASSLWLLCLDALLLVGVATRVHRPDLQSRPVP
jgi:CP family cyanate transporter-like MFS transporter